MIEKKKFSYPSDQDGIEISAVCWQDDAQEPMAIFQIAHGMAEYIDRYNEFARFLAERRILVVGNDHLGHGNSVLSDEQFGYFYQKNGSYTHVQDMHSLRERISSEYPGIPYFILGHSMGSFLLRHYLVYYGKGLQGAIIMGTGNQPPLLLHAAIGLTNIMAGLKGWNYRSRLINNLSFGSYNKQFEPVRTSADWLTKDNEIVNAYVQDKRCSFIFTLNGYHNLFSGMLFISKKQNIDKIPKRLPLLLVSGKEDPVGECGAAVTKLYHTYQKCGIASVEMKLYEGDRHEILNELDRSQVYEDIYNWLLKRI